MSPKAMVSGPEEDVKRDVLPLSVQRKHSYWTGEGLLLPWETRDNKHHLHINTEKISDTFKVKDYSELKETPFQWILIVQ